MAFFLLRVIRKTPKNAMRHLRMGTREGEKTGQSEVGRLLPHPGDGERETEGRGLQRGLAAGQPWEAEGPDMGGGGR